MGARGALTVRFPAELLGKAREVKEDGESLNDVVVQAVEREVRRRQGLQVYDDIMRHREEIFRSSGIQPDSTPIIRALREGEDRDG